MTFITIMFEVTELHGELVIKALKAVVTLRFPVETEETFDETTDQVGVAVFQLVDFCQVIEPV